MTHLGFEPATSCVTIGYSKYLAIDQKEKLPKQIEKISRPVWNTNHRPPAFQADCLTTYPST